jgi:hypothetical protein
MAGLIRRAIITLPVGLLLLIGGGVAIAAGVTAVGAVLIVLAVLSVSFGCVLMLKVRNRARAFSRDAQARHQADLDAAFRDHQHGGPALPERARRALGRPAGMATAPGYAALPPARPVCSPRMFFASRNVPST